MDIPSLKTAYKYAAQLIAEAISELRKDKKDIITSLSTIKDEVASRGKLSDTISEDILAKLQESLTELKNKEVTITNAGEINGDIVNGLNAIAEALRFEIQKLDKDIIINTDLEPLLKAFQKSEKEEKSDNKDIVKALQEIIKKIPVLKEKETVDYTLILDDIATALEELGKKEVVIDLSKTEKALGGIFEALNAIKPFEFPERLVKDNRVKIDISDEQLKKMGGSISVASGGGSSGISKNTAGTQINPATEEKQTSIISAIQAIPAGGDATSYLLKYDEGVTYTYIGNAVPGTLTSAAFWRIKRLTNADNTIVYAGGASTFVNIWDNRAALSYS